MDAKPSGVKINIAPLEREELALPHASSEREYVQRL
jgi:hypothetical protein